MKWKVWLATIVAVIVGVGFAVPASAVAPVQASPTSPNVVCNTYTVGFFEPANGYVFDSYGKWIPGTPWEMQLGSNSCAGVAYEQGWLGPVSGMITVRIRYITGSGTFTSAPVRVPQFGPNDHNRFSDPRHRVGALPVGAQVRIEYLDGNPAGCETNGCTTTEII